MVGSLVRVLGKNSAAIKTFHLLFIPNSKKLLPTIPPDRIEGNKLTSSSCAMGSVVLEAAAADPDANNGGSAIVC